MDFNKAKKNILGEKLAVFIEFEKRAFGLMSSG